MEFKQFYLGCLAHASYLVGSEGEAAIVDPQRDVADYLEEARARGLAIRFVIETHLHADFVSGHHELAERTGAEIVFGRKAGADFEHRAVADGDELRVGRLKLRVLETPGHTPESICVVVNDESDAPRLVFTGDTLFVGDAGRPDLVGAQGFSPQQMAEQLHASLGKLLALPDDVEIYPAHGAGSLCGRNMSTERSSTIGEQRRTNPALQPMSRERFVEMMTADLPPQPRYFAADAALNRRGSRALAQLPVPAALSAAKAADVVKQGAVVLDVRSSAEHGAGHVPGSLNIGLQGQFASWAGTLIAPDRPIVLLCSSEAERDDAALRLARVGLENVAGEIAGGIAAWKAAGFAIGTTPQVEVGELAARLARGERPTLLDVRRPAEHARGHVAGAINLPLDRLAVGETGPLGPLDRSAPLLVICQSGYRSAAALGVLEGLGFEDLRNVVGGTGAWTAGGHPTEGSQAAACPAS
jgi:glyoxylase-like metal-dependent hydrolase (beta-lactamase superfamily II)/rhodanese-related sulfurtransferase